MIRIILLCLVGWAIAHMGYAQTVIPAVQLKDLNGRSVDLSELTQRDGPAVISVWATWCGPCKKELNVFEDLYEKWKEDYGIEIFAISVDNSRGLRKVKPMVAEKGWSFPIYTDENQNIMRGLSFQSIPHTFLVDGSGNILYSHSGYLPGDELELEEELKKVAKAK